MRHGAALVWVLLLSTGCAVKDSDPVGRAGVAIESVQTDLRATACARRPDQVDPNETPYLQCQGTAGYQLLIRKVDSGRLSIDIVDPARRTFALNYQEFVTREMFSLAPTAEWRVELKEGRRVPIALLVRVQVRGDPTAPERITRSYLALAKITSSQMCVTDRITEGSLAQAQLYELADSAPVRACLAPQPHMRRDGVLIR